MIDVVCPRTGLRPCLARLLSAGARRPVGRPVPDNKKLQLIRDHTQIPARDTWKIVRQARDMARPTTLDYIARTLDTFEELHGDRLASDSPPSSAGSAGSGTSR